MPLTNAQVGTELQNASGLVIQSTTVAPGGFQVAVQVGLLTAARLTLMNVQGELEVRASDAELDGVNNVPLPGGNDPLPVYTANAVRDRITQIRTAFASVASLATGTPINDSHRGYALAGLAGLLGGLIGTLQTEENRLQAG